jgi:hypothetical protein
MPAQPWSGLILSSGVLAASGDSGFVQWPNGGYFERGLFLFLPSLLSGDETLDVVVSAAWDSSGTGAFTFHTFAQVLNTNVAARFVYPGGESSALAVASKSQSIPLPPFYKIAWTLGGTARTGAFRLFGVLG